MSGSLGGKRHYAGHVREGKVHYAASCDGVPSSFPRTRESRWGEAAHSPFRIHDVGSSLARHGAPSGVAKHEQRLFSSHLPCTRGFIDKPSRI